MLCQFGLNILFSNERNINILGTHHFGRLGFVEIGALSVGRIVERCLLDELFKRTRSINRFNAVSRSFGLAAPPLRCLASKGNGVHRRTSSAARGRASRHSCGSAKP
jgi:hypothetical protein